MSDQPARPSPWTPALVTAIGGATAVVLTALAAVLVTLQGVRQGQKENGAKVDTVIEKAAEIHVLANKNFSDLTAQLAVANAKIEGLEKVVRTNAADKKIADELAAKP